MHNLFIYLFICRICKVAALMLFNYAIAPCSYKGDISASTICRL